MKLPRVSAVVAAAVLAPAVLFPSSASAADTPKPAGISGPDTGSDSVKDTAPEDTASQGDTPKGADGQEQRDRAEVERILANSPAESWCRVHEGAAKALQGTAADLRHFLETELDGLQKSDNRLLVARLRNGAGPVLDAAARAAINAGDDAIAEFLKTGQYAARAEDEDRAEVERILADSPAWSKVREGAAKALQGTAADLRHFLEAELEPSRRTDNRVRVVQIESLGGPAVKKAAAQALEGSYQDILDFLATGQHAARAEDEDRARIEAILADPKTGRGVREGAEKALKGGAAELRHFLEAELPRLRADDNRVKLSQLMSSGGPAVREAAGKALDAGTDEAVEAFLNGGFAKAKAQDDRVRVSQIAETGGPAVKKAALAALEGGDADITAFLDEGWAKARAEDEAATTTPGNGNGTSNGNGGTGTSTGADGSGQQPQPVQPAGYPGTTGTATTTTATGTGTGALAATGTDGLGWEAGGAAAALAAGAALVVA
ncbi:ALF repeat-containing protein, partial [Kitasatospora sp. NPDC056783]|uniref:ALF repeat-containing protein n=1 Tax=Kitasatospora sp. NPDC056783 TaxID=3345943 RepID=UPI003684491C